MTRKVVIAKQVIAVRSAGQDHRVTMLSGNSVSHSERMMRILYKAIASADHTFKVQVRIRPMQQGSV